MTPVRIAGAGPVRSKLAKLRTASFAELRERIGQKAAAWLEVQGLARTVHELSDSELWDLLDPSACRAGSWTDTTLLAHFRTRAHPSFFRGVREGTSAALLRGFRWAPERAALIAAADRLCAGVFDLLGHSGLSFGSPIDWQLDPTTNRRSPARHWSQIDYLDPEVVGDHKVVWELNRHQHFVVLGRAYQVTGNARYARAFAEQLTSWMDQNRPKQGVNWASSLEVGYRAISWLWALELFRDARELDAELLKRVLKYLHVHGRHLERYLSTYFSPNTHLTGEALGLYYLGMLLPELRRAPVWRSLGQTILERELLRQVYDDGVYFEQASYYHRYTVDIYVHAVLLARLNGRAILPAMTDRLSAAVEHLADLTRPDGTIPMIGDDDGGRLVRLEERSLTDVSATLATAAVVLSRPEIARVSRGASEQVVWLLGPQGADAADRASRGAPPAHLSRLFPTGGYAIMRDGWGEHANHAVIDCGPHGTMNSGHAHSDALSIEIAALGCPVLVDPGTYTYTKSVAERNRFRHSAAHNTVTVDGEAASVPAGPFSWTTRADARVEEWWAGNLVDWFVGSHPGFGRLSDPAEHRRIVLFARHGYWVVLDSVLASGDHEFVTHWHAAIGSSVGQISPREAWLSARCAERSSRLFFSVAGDVESVEWGEDWVSPAYGEKSVAPAARVITRGTGNRRLLTVLVPAAENESVSVRELPCGGSLAIVVDRPGTHDLLVFGSGAVVRAGAVTMQGEGAMIRRFSPAGPVTAVALFGELARIEVDSFVFEASGAAEMRLDGGRWIIAGEGRVSAI